MTWWWIGFAIFVLACLDRYYFNALRKARAERLHRAWVAEWYEKTGVPRPSSARPRPGR
jgi:hypothetical protein